MNSPKSHSKLVLWTSVLTIVPYCFYLYTFAPFFFLENRGLQWFCALHFTKALNLCLQRNCTGGKERAMLKPHEHEASFLETESLGRRPLYSENQFKDLWGLLAAGKDCVVFFVSPQIQRISALPTESDS